MADTFHLGYVDAVMALERARLSIMKNLGWELDQSEFSRLTPAQAMIIFWVGQKKLTFSELQKTCQSSTNVSHNLRNLVAWGFVERQRSREDRRVVHIRLTRAGYDARNFVDNVLRAQSAMAEQLAGVTLTALDNLITSLKQIDHTASGIVR